VSVDQVCLVLVACLQKNHRDLLRSAGYQQVACVHVLELVLWALLLLRKALSEDRLWRR